MHRRVPLFLVAALAAAPVSAAHAAAPWSAPQALTDAATAVSRAPAVLSSPGAGTIVAFGVGAQQAPGNLALARRPLGAPLFAAPRITTTHSDATRVLSYGRSRIVVVSQGASLRPGLHVRFGSAFGSLGAPRTVSAKENVLRFSAAANARGDVVVAFVALRPAPRPGASQRRVVVVARRAAGRPFARPETIVGRGQVNDVATAISAGGDIVVAYDQQGRVQTRSRPAGRSWQPVDEVDPRAVKGARLRIALGARGRAVLAIFEQALSEGGDNGPAKIVAAVRRPGHHFGSPQLLESFPERFPDFFGTPASAEVALDGDGALLAWTGRVGGDFGVRVASLAGSRFGAPVDVSPPGQQLGGVAVGDGGRATVVWSQIATDPAPPTATIGAAVRAPGAAAFGPPELVSDVEASARQAAVAYAPGSGPPTVAWVAATGPLGTGVKVATRATP
jgi:YD repeat-containing protein